MSDNHHVVLPLCSCAPLFQEMLTATSVDRVLAACREEIISRSRDKYKKRETPPARDPGLSCQAVAAKSNAKGAGGKQAGERRRGNNNESIELMDSDEGGSDADEPIATSNSVSVTLNTRH